MDRFLLKLVDQQPCMGSNPDGEGPCPLLTALAEAEHESQNERQLRVYPYCSRHLYIGWPEPTPEELELSHWCVTNFVIQHFGGQGTSEVLGECPADSIPAPYEACEDEDEAYYVAYRDEQGQEKHGVAVFLTSWENWWEWYEFPAPPPS